ncbi:DapH/DapD/GlmU-related protein [Nibrella saemangeumensis]|uniref:DapH/DapD/GlmU-related protein n=1 Tax=Nibrella saemangeumensis TaxID=1084526 RepID=A0ABP8N318_9BACT
MRRIIFVYFFKFCRNYFRRITNVIDYLLCYIVFYGQNIKFQDFKTKGLPFVSIALGGHCEIGSGFKMNNGLINNPIGSSNRCILFVDKGAKLKIGNNVGISQTSIICHHHITLGNFVKVGGGVRIFDTDFHAISPTIRKDSKLDHHYKSNRAVFIKDNVFIGAFSTILKGVTIGENSIVGACSVVTKDIPDNEVWAGNPAKRIKSLTP